MKTILIVEDNEDSLTLLELLLSATYNVLSASSVKKAKNIISEVNNIDLLLTDYSFPDGMALDIIRETNCPNKRILLTGHSHVFTSKKFDACLIKPVEPDRLLEIINAILSSS